MAKFSFKGTATALVTPFNADGSVDFESYGKLIDFQIENGIEGIVPCGSTGEAATMSKDEKISVIRYAVERAAGRVKVIAGTGSNDTMASVELTKKAKELGADAVLLVSPYYNKPGQNGMYEHFRAIAEAVDIPQVLYNVPGRTGTNMLPETQLKIAENFTNVVATKEASANLEQIQEIIAHAPSHFSVLAGDDVLALPIIACGGTGTIAVISNYAPKEFGDTVRLSLEGRFEEARKLQFRLLPLMHLNFVESNPIPVKGILAMKGLIGEVYRLPMTPLQEGNREKIRTALQKAGLL